MVKYIRITRQTDEPMIRFLADIDILVAAVNLVDVADHACALCRHGCDEKGNTGTDIRRCHISCTKAVLMVMAYNHCTMRIA